ncbi:GyrI-like domain-containing protein [Cohnella yongneupensis]|uniref:GyrI-like domain-containing protein n=1 Tax=Cohnella yongneupensis TaxID=425006 RepID=A0ABW0QXA7_9BACL
MRVRIVEMPEMKAAVIRSEQSGEGTRKAWRGIRELLGGHSSVKNEDYGLVFIPEWQWATGVRELWTGVEVSGFEELPDGLETIILPARKYAKLTIRGNGSRMEDGYAFLNQWFEQEGIERDVTEGSFGFEANRLNPVNPFDIPRSEIDFFDYDIYAPIKHAEALETDRFQHIESIDIVAEPSRRIIGIERFVAQQDGEQAAEAIPAIWEAFHALRKERSIANDSEESFGLFTYAPPFGPGQNFLYLAGVEIAENDGSPIPDGMIERTIPAGEFAVVTYRGQVADIHEAWGFFHGSWRGHSEYNAIDDYEYERYDCKYRGPDNGESVIELHFPVVLAKSIVEV